MQPKSRLIKYLIAPIVAIVLTLAGCGGGSDSSSGGGSGTAAGLASVSGNVSSGIASASQDDAGVLMARIFKSLISEAHAAGVQDVTVELLLGGAVVGTQMTDSNGNFRFNDLVPGNYSLRLSRNSTVIGEEAAITLAADTSTRIELNVSGDVMNLEVNANNGQISGEVEDDNSSDDISDDDSSDDESLDDDSSDDISDDDSSDDDSSDDGNT